MWEGGLVYVNIPKGLGKHGHCGVSLGVHQSVYDSGCLR